MRVAIVHDWLVAPGGAEKVLEQLIQCYPEADLFCLADFLEDRRPLGGRPVTTSFLQHVPFVRRRSRAYSLLVPHAIGQFDLSGYDLIITTSDTVAPHVSTARDQTHVSYAHTPTRHAWEEQHRYLRDARLMHGPKSWVARVLLHCLRGRHANSTNSVDRLIVNSRFAARRVMKTFRRDAAVIAPPVDVREFGLRKRKEDFYVTASRLVSHKRIDLIVEAFSTTPQRKLVVIGDGPLMAPIRARAGKNVTFLGDQPRNVLKDYLQRARAFVFAAEDFDIVALEAQACGTPVITFGRCGAHEAVVPLGDARPSGVYFGEQTVQSILGGIDRFERHSAQITPVACRANAERYSAAVFRRAFMAEMTRTIAAVSLRSAAVKQERSAVETARDMRRQVESAHKSSSGH